MRGVRAIVAGRADRHRPEYYADRISARRNDERLLSAEPSYQVKEFTRIVHETTTGTEARTTIDLFVNYPGSTEAACRITPSALAVARGVRKERNAAFL